MNNKEDTRSRRSGLWWYRLLQIVYVLLVGVQISLLAIVSLALAPQVSVRDSQYSIICDDSRELTDILGSRTAYGGSALGYADDERRIKFACSRPDLSYVLAEEEYKEVITRDTRETLGGGRLLSTRLINPEIPEVRNYQVVLIGKVYDSSWLNHALYTLFGLIVVIVFSLLVRAVFLYVAFKESLLANMFVLVRGRRASSSPH